MPEAQWLKLAAALPTGTFRRATGRVSWFRGAAQPQPFREAGVFGSVLLYLLLSHPFDLNRFENDEECNAAARPAHCCRDPSRRSHRCLRYALHLDILASRFFPHDIKCDLRAIDSLDRCKCNFRAGQARLGPAALSLRHRRRRTRPVFLFSSKPILMRIILALSRGYQGFQNTDSISRNGRYVVFYSSSRQEMVQPARSDSVYAHHIFRTFRENMLFLSFGSPEFLRPSPWGTDQYPARAEARD